MLITWLTTRTMIWLRAAALDRSDEAPKSYAELVGGTLGHRAGVAARVFSMLKLLTNCVVFTTVATELAFQIAYWLRGMDAAEARAAFARPPLEALESREAFLASPQLCTLAFLVVASPLAFLPRIDSLRHTAALGMILIAAITFLVVVHAFVLCGGEAAAPCPWTEAPPALFPVSMRAVRCDGSIGSALALVSAASRCSVPRPCARCPS